MCECVLYTTDFILLNAFFCLVDSADICCHLFAYQDNHVQWITFIALSSLFSYIFLSLSSFLLVDILTNTTNLSYFRKKLIRNWDDRILYKNKRQFFRNHAKLFDILYLTKMVPIKSNNKNHFKNNIDELSQVYFVVVVCVSCFG